MAFDYTDPNAWQNVIHPSGQGLGKYNVTEDELRAMGIRFGDGPTGFTDIATGQALDPNNIPLPARAQIPALLDKTGAMLGKYANQAGQYAKQAGQAVGNIWDRIDDEYQRDPDKFGEAVKRFGRSVFEEQNTGVQWGPPGAKVTDWGKHFGAAADVYNPDSQYNIEKRAAQRAEQKDIIAVGMAQVESQIQQITLGKNQRELEKLLNKVENPPYDDLPAELKPVYNSLIAQGNTPQQASTIIGEMIRKRYEAKTREIEVGIEKTNADIAKTMSDTDAQKLKTALAEANRGRGNPDSLNDIDNGSIRAVWDAEFNKTQGSEQQKAQKAWGVVRTILEEREKLKTQTQQTENAKIALDTRLKQWGYDTGDPQNTLKGDDEALAAWNTTYQTAEGTQEEKINKAWGAVDSLQKMRESNKGMIDLSSANVTDFDKEIFTGIQRLRAAFPEQYEGVRDVDMYGDAKAFLEGRKIDVHRQQKLNESDIKAYADQRAAVAITRGELQGRIANYTATIDILREIPSELWSSRKTFIGLTAAAKSFFKGQRDTWEGAVSTLNKLTTAMTFDYIAQTKGAITEKEMDLFKSAVVSWEGTKESNIEYVQFLRMKATNKLNYLTNMLSLLDQEDHRGRAITSDDLKLLQKNTPGYDPAPMPKSDIIKPKNIVDDGTGSEAKTGNFVVIPPHIIEAYYANPTLTKWNALNKQEKYKGAANMPPKPAE